MSNHIFYGKRKIYAPSKNAWNTNYAQINSHLFCLDLRRESRVYILSSALLEHIYKLTEAPSQMLIIMEKNNATNSYSIVKHVAKGLNLNAIKRPEEINCMI